MPDDTGRLTSADLPIINDFIRRASRDSCLTCPVTGSRVHLSQWRISDRLCMLPVSGQQLQPDLKTTAPVLSCRSPAGSMVYLYAAYIGLLKQAVAH